ncbi:hypothetical protein PVAND_005937 [Polypedilum vanderplanki]|uniref:Methionine aminopeptidase n=1 Tax=Polypedilum vanderplanki TaxID=319348 RepID=A0A9J6C2P6_POLVA|nr:hypothetical protein PVAND_005937 [Polypedilum vanderplanki]
MVVIKKLNFQSFSMLIQYRKYNNSFKETFKTYKIPDHIEKPFYYYERNKPADMSGCIEIKSEDDIAKLRESCTIAANVLKKCHEIVKIGVSTEQINQFVFNEIIKSNAYPSPLYYCGFPKSICTSVNSVACHGIPNENEILKDGDIINIDVTVFKEFHGDCSKTFLVGKVDERSQYLVMHNEIALNEAIKICKPGASFNLIGKIISDYAKKVNLNVIADFIGHGIGRNFHCAPEIYHFENEINTEIMRTGMVFTIEPIFSEGSQELELWEDGWTASTIDSSRTAQCEHTILITKDGNEILTKI